ncbi:transposase [Streptomyces sp. NPDC093111]|uniref:transposase n=1 Tax=Streptomyces sp. NPDC093111 TaxID=3154978 RepID=UPI00343BB668
MVCRDRAPFFAEGATAGAPQAVQVADRWHLRRNLSEAAERCVADHRGCLQVLAPDPAQPAPPSRRISKAPPARPGQGDNARFADRTRDKHATFHEPLTAGVSRRAIGRQLRMTSRIVKLLADATAPEDLFRGQYSPSARANGCHSLNAVRRDDLPGLHTLAAGIDRDRDAVTACLTPPWSSGVVEGHVNRIEMLKRHMFGRADFHLFRKRVLLYS